ncbi:MAG TPA: GNAT family protein [Burkholderiaceae bacterium]
MLKGELCMVRHLAAADLDAYLPLFNDLDARGPYYSHQFRSPAVMRAEFERTGMVDEVFEHFVITDHAGKLLGTIFHFKSRTPYCREIGYRLFDTGHAGKGVMTEAARLLVDHLFAEYTYERLQLLMAPDNVASERVAQKCGFSKEGTFRHMFFNNGKYGDAHIYSLLRGEWQASRG